MKALAKPPVSDHLTDHDRTHCTTYIRVLDAVSAGADPAEIARVMLGVDMDRDPQHGYQLFEAYHARALWMSRHGYQELLASDEAP